VAKRKRQAGAPDAEPLEAGAPQPGPEEETTTDAPERVEEDLDSLLADTRRERDEYLQLAQRARADFENYRKRVARETEEAERRGKTKLAAELIPAVDNLERALQAAGIDTGTDAGKVDGSPEPGDALGHGVLLVYRDLQELLVRAGVETVDPAGEKFDPEWHEAVSTRSADGVEGGTIVEVVEKGYKLDSQVIRAARVVVSE
jgi:molecular chaperone GrpE